MRGFPWGDALFSALIIDASPNNKWYQATLEKHKRDCPRQKTAHHHDFLCPCLYASEHSRNIKPLVTRHKTKKASTIVLAFEPAEREGLSSLRSDIGGLQAWSGKRHA